MELRLRGCYTRYLSTIVAAYYFIKWVEAQPLVNMTQANVIKFIKTQIIYRFVVPETITIDQGTMFTGEKMKALGTMFIGEKMKASSSNLSLVNSVFSILCLGKRPSRGYQQGLNRHDQKSC